MTETISEKNVFNFIITIIYYYYLFSITFSSALVPSTNMEEAGFMTCMLWLYV